MGESEVRDETEVAEIDEKDDVSSLVDEDEVEVKKKRKPGMIYLSIIPKGFNVIKIRERFSVHGKVKRIFLQPGVSKNKKTFTSKAKPRTYYTEGWIEFESKRVAKFVAEQLNNTLVGGRSKSKSYSQIWNIKYLPRFKWAHLNERLAYEKATRRQRLRAEVFQAKKESHNFAKNLDISEKLAKWRKKNGPDDATEEEAAVFPRQRKMEPAEEKKGAVKKNKKKAVQRKEFLSNLFGRT